MVIFKILKKFDIPKSHCQPVQLMGIILSLNDVGLALDGVDHHQGDEQEIKQKSHSSKHYSIN